MKVTMRALDSIRPYERNPRINDAAVDAVAASITAFGFRQPIVVDAEGVIVVGHVRWKAAKKLGLAKVPVHVAADLTPERARAYRLADNKTNELAEWDLGALTEEFADLPADLDMSLFGFTAAQLAGPDLAEGLTDPDTVPEPPDEPVSKPGNLWIYASTVGSVVILRRGMAIRGKSAFGNAAIHGPAGCTQHRNRSNSSSVPCGTTHGPRRSATNLSAVVVLRSSRPSNSAGAATPSRSSPGTST